MAEVGGSEVQTSRPKPCAFEKMPEPVYFLPKWTSPEVCTLYETRVRRGAALTLTSLYHQIDPLAHGARGVPPQELVHTIMRLSLAARLSSRLCLVPSERESAPRDDSVGLVTTHITDAAQPSISARRLSTSTQLHANQYTV